MTATSIRVHVLRPEWDCTLNGVTSKTSDFTLYASREAYESNPDAKPEDALIVIHRTVFGNSYVHCEPAEHPIGKCGPMMGGNYVTTSDSRYREVAGIAYPLPVHDRFEGRELNELLSR